jgi:hypothetical protein
MDALSGKPGVGRAEIEVEERLLGCHRRQLLGRATQRKASGVGVMAGL